MVARKPTIGVHHPWLKNAPNLKCTIITFRRIKAAVPLSSFKNVIWQLFIEFAHAKSLQSPDLIMSLNSRNFCALSQKEKKVKPVESARHSQPYLPTLPTPALPGWGSHSPHHLLVFWGPSLLLPAQALPFFKPSQSNRYCSVQAERIVHSAHWPCQVCRHSLSSNLSSLLRAHLVCLLSLQGTAGRCLCRLLS